MLEQQIIEATSLSAFKNGSQKLIRRKMGFFIDDPQSPIASLVVVCC